MSNRFFIILLVAFVVTWYALSQFDAVRLGIDALTFGVTLDAERYIVPLPTPTPTPPLPP